MFAADTSFESAQFFDFSGINWLKSCKYMNQAHAEWLSRLLGEDTDLDFSDLQRWRWHGLICLNFERLPSVELTHIGTLPTVPALYFVLTDCVIYVGKTKNIRHRWYRHHCLKLVSQFSGIRVSWVEATCDSETLSCLERGFIDSLNPELNGKSTGQTTPWRNADNIGELSSVGKLAESCGMNRYRFWKATGLSQVTAYRLYEDSAYKPSERVMNRVRLALNL